ncbi:MAG: hypothetical protein M0Q43_03615 [Methanothrix sp.]|jgi:hypothetical protein|nr:hypothetical protein [Methanothrix sp.]
MRIIVLALLLALAFGTAQATPLQGSDGNATVVLFGASRTPLDDENATQEILKVDVGFMGAENATYQLVDADNNIYLPGLYKPLSSGKQLVYFLVPKDSLFKLMNVTPKGGAPIYINWWATPKGSNDNLIVRYYGITDWLINTDEQGIVVQVRVQNNGTRNLIVGPENFTLLDQWGWSYRPTLGFDQQIVEPGNATDRVLVGFTGISLLSRPAALAYDNGASNQIVIMFERDYVPLSDELVYGANATTSTASAASVQPASVAALPATDQTAQSAAVQAPVQQNTSTKISSIKDKVAASKARLAATKESLDKQTPETNETASTSGNASNSSSSISV